MTLTSAHPKSKLMKRFAALGHTCEKGSARTTIFSLIV